MMMTKIDFHFRGDNITLPFCGGYLPFFPEFFDSFSFFPKQQACCFTAVFLYQSRALTRSLHPFDARASNLPHFLLHDPSPGGKGFLVPPLPCPFLHSVAY
ncbi:hypothetical protein I3843_14G130600 [Carya illinoinensis]|nr:hypothetical protein I3843_14G130600 [Carya illinoinensis]